MIGLGALFLLTIVFLPIILTILIWKRKMWTSKIRWFVTLLMFGVFWIYPIIMISSENTFSTDPQSCLIGVDWVYPSSDNPTGAWKFSSDGTFNSSTTLFGGMSAWGNWEIIEDGRIKIIYTRSTENNLPDPQILELSDCNKLKIGETYYVKN